MANTKAATKVSAQSQVQTVPRAGWKNRLARAVNHTGRFVLHSAVPEILLIASLVIAHYLPNSDFSYPSEVILPTVLFGVLAAVSFYIYKLILRTSLAAHAAALPLAYGFYAYSYAYPTLHKWAEHLVLKRFDTPFTSALTVILFWAIAFGLGGFVLQRIVRLSESLRQLPLLKIAVFAVCFVFAVQAFKMGQRMWIIRHQLSYQQQSQALPQDKTKAAASTKPNIYYLVFDRYASATTLDKDYDYDNSPMTNFLANQGFVTRDDPYANYPFTTQSITSTLAMDYHTDLDKLFRNDAAGFQTAFPFRTIFNDPPIADALKTNGYNYNQVSSWWDFTRNVPTADDEPTESFRLRVFGKDFWLTDLQRDMVNKSFLSPLLLKGLTVGKHAVVKYDHDNNPRQNFEGQLSALETIAANSKTQSKPQFTFAHILSPHDPYIFNTTGGDPDYSGDRTDEGADETVKYTNQLTYVNTRFEQLISDMRTKDPNAVIIIQADEGPYPKQFRGTLTPTHYYDPINLPLQQMQQKFGIMASYYMPGVDAQTVTKQVDSSVNVFRFVLDNYLGYQLPQLPDCQFTAGDKFYMYNFQLVTGKLKGTEEPAACKAYQ